MSKKTGVLKFTERNVFVMFAFILKVLIFFEESGHFDGYFTLLDIVAHGL